MQEAILHALKGSATDFGPIFRAKSYCKDYFTKLETVYGTVASFDTSMSNFYNVTQDINDKIQIWSSESDQK